MVYELYEKGIRGKALKPTEIRVCKASISFGDEIGDDIRKLEYVEVYLDKESNKVGFKPTKNGITGFHTPERANSKKLYIASKAFTGILPMGDYIAKKEDDMWVIKVTEIATKK